MKVLRTLSMVFVLSALLAACATLPQSSPETGPNMRPHWVTTHPKPAGGYTYFVASGSDVAGNQGRATRRAVQSLVRTVVATLRAGSNAQASPEMTAELASIEDGLRQAATTSAGTGRAGSNKRDFLVIERWVEHSGERVTVYLLGRYSTAALEADRSRLIALEREGSDPAAVLQKRGDELLSQGKAYRAAVEYLKAALAATNPQVSNSEAKIQASIAKAEEAIAEIRLEVVTDNLEGRLGTPLPGPFLIDVMTGGDRNLPVAGARFRISYPVPRENGQVGTQAMVASTRADGRLSFRLPPPQLLGAQSVTAELDLSAELEPLARAAEGQKSLLSSLDERIASVHAVLHYRTTSEAASVPTGVLVMDLDRGGTPMPDDDTAAGIESALMRAGYHILPIQSNRSILGIDLPDLVKILKNNFGDKIRRAIVGQARISGFDHTDGTYIVKVSGRVDVADLDTGKVLFATSQVKLSRASDASSAINAAFKDLGTSIGNEIKNRLR